MIKKKSFLTVAIVVVAIASLLGVVGVSYAAWVEFTSKPTGNWVVESNIPTDITITKTVADNAKYMGHNGTEDEIFISKAVVTMAATRDMSIKGMAVVTCTKNGVLLTIEEDKKFVVVFFNAEGEQIAALDLKANIETIVTVGVIFPDLSDAKYQKSTFSIKVDISEAKPLA